jgi:hypothetical protein
MAPVVVAPSRPPLGSLRVGPSGHVSTASSRRCVLVSRVFPVAVRRCLAFAPTCSLLILVFSTQAAPLMWRVGAAPDDPALLGALLDGFVAWTVPRLVAAIASFSAVLSALTLVATKIDSGTGGPMSMTAGVRARALGRCRSPAASAPRGPARWPRGPRPRP